MVKETYMKDTELLNAVKDLQVYTQTVYNLLMDGKTCVARDKVVGLSQKLVYLQKRVEDDLKNSGEGDKI